MRYQIEISKTAAKFLRKLSNKNFALVANAIDSLSTDPYQKGIKKLKGYDNVFRLRAGNYRILYEIDGGRLVVAVIEIGDRKDIYE
jgi:mRNA interferase RelE/StbE